MKLSKITLLAFSENQPLTCNTSGPIFKFGTCTIQKHCAKRCMKGSVMVKRGFFIIWLTNGISQCQFSRLIKQS